MLCHQALQELFSSLDQANGQVVSSVELISGFFDLRSARGLKPLRRLELLLRLGLRRLRPGELMLSFLTSALTKLE
jgi:hypothetical protein